MSVTKQIKGAGKGNFSSEFKLREYEGRTRRQALSLLVQKLTWIAQRHFARQVDFCKISDLFKMQQLTNNLLKKYAHGHVKYLKIKTYLFSSMVLVFLPAYVSCTYLLCSCENITKQTKFMFTLQLMFPNLCANKFYKHTKTNKHVLSDRFLCHSLT